MNIQLLLFHSVIGGSSLTRLSESVVTLYHEKEVVLTSKWTETLMMRNQSFSCSLVDDPKINKRRAHLRLFAAQMAPLTGHCAQKDAINLCINDRVDQTLANGRSRSFSVSEKNIRESGDQFFTEPTSGNLAAVVTCTNRPVVGKSKGARICRKGDEDIVGGRGVIRQTFLNGSALVGKAEVVPLASLGCDSDGSIDEMQVKTDSITIESFTVENAGEEIIHINISSPFCKSSSEQITALPEMKSACFSAEFNRRHFEYCHEHSVGFGLVNRKQISVVRANFVQPVLTNWTFNSKSLDASFATDRACAPLLPALSDDFLIELDRNKVQIKGVGGSFNPIFHESISGTLLFDSKNPTACSHDAFPESIIPKQQARWIALVERGGCMFQEKALLAEKRGAAALIILNVGKRSMIPAMASVPGHAFLSIPSVLVDSDASFLTKYTGSKATVSAAPMAGSTFPSDNQTLAVKVSAYCDPESLGRNAFGQACQVGDKVIVRREGEAHEHAGHIVEKLSHDTFIVSTAGASSSETFSAWELFKNSETPCTGQMGIVITDVEHSDTCEVSVRIHSPFLCADRRFRDPPKQNRDIVCTLN